MAHWSGTIYAAMLASALAAGSSAMAQAAPSHTPLHKNSAVARLAGSALHVSQDVSASLKKEIQRREAQYGPSDPTARADRKALRQVGHRSRYFRHLKRRSEGR